jgi:CRP-like cAMP-binding protein
MAKAGLLNPAGNFLLNKLARADYDHLARTFETVSLEPEQLIYRHDEPIEYVYFPTTAMLSWIATTSEGERVEVGVVGWEGMVGIPEILGYESSPYAVEVELPGEAIRIRVGQFKEEFQRFNSIHSILFRYTYTALMQLAQSNACGRFHTVEERLCRWLLMAHDRSPTDELRLTQEILAGMIGARRPAVTLVVGALQKAGLIQARRGRIILLDRERMEAAACECYPIIRRAFDQFLGLEAPPGDGVNTDAKGGPKPPTS